LGMLVAVTSVLTVTGSALGAPPDPATNDIETINHVMFDLDLITFIRQRSALRRAYPRLDWTTDGCSAPIVGESGRSFNFRHACMRHDFGYRNYKARDMFTTDARVRIDTQFRQDLDATCGPKIRTFKIRCIAWAEIFFTAVRLAGGP
ncbi:MAG: phospholipase A2, partial [Actinomycetota bacterium]